MRTLVAWIGALAVASLPLPISAQTASSIDFPGRLAPGISICVKQADGTCVPVSAVDPLPVTGIAGGSAGDASAANQATQITTANLTNTTLGAVTASPTANTIGDRLKVLNTTLGAPFQAGGAIGNTAFGATQSGTWNITNITGTVSLPTGAATAANQASTNTKLDSVIAQTRSLASAATSASTNVNAAAASTQLLATNANQLGGAIVNDSTAVLYIKLSSGASATSFDYYLAGSASGVPAQFELPANWSGPVFGIWASATGAARISERTQ